MKVWITEEKRYIDVGTLRWSVTWYTVLPSAASKEEIDFDTDLEENVDAYPARDAALAKAKEVAGASYFGVAMLQQQRAGREYGSFGEWNDIGRSEEVVE